MRLLVDILKNSQKLDLGRHFENRKNPKINKVDKTLKSQKNEILVRSRLVLLGVVCRVWSRRISTWFCPSVPFRPGLAPIYRRSEFQVNFEIGVGNLAVNSGVNFG